jgi:hypothetical protein
LKGEFLLTIAGKDYKARLNIDAIMRIEQACGKSVIKLAQDMSMNQGILVSDILVVLYNGLRGGGNDLNEIQVKNIIGDSYIESLTAVANLLSYSLAGNSDEETEGSPEKKTE